MKVKVLVAQSCQNLFDPGGVAHQAPLSTGFSRQEYWSGLPFPSLGYLPNRGIEPRSPVSQVDSLLPEPPGEPMSEPKCGYFLFQNLKKSRNFLKIFNDTPKCSFSFEQRPSMGKLRQVLEMPRIESRIKTLPTIDIY